MIDPSIVGRELDEISFPVDRSKLAELARAYGDDSPVWHDPQAARDAGFGQVPVPPTVTVIVDHWRAGGTAGLVEQVGADLARVLHGGVEWEYHTPVRIGDTLTSRQTIADVTRRQGKRGGDMTFVKIDTEFLNQHGELAIRRTDTLIEREI